MAESFFTPLKIVNVVLTARLVAENHDSVDNGNLAEQEYQFNLDNIAQNIKGACAEYYPRNFAALKLCRTRPFSKALFFRSGKIVCVGNVTVDIGRESLPWFAKHISDALGGGYVIKDLRMQNIVATACIEGDRHIDLNKISRAFPNTQYEPEMFPGCAFRYGQEWKQVVNLFSSGKIVVTGIKDIETLILRTRTFIENLYAKRVELGIA